MTITIVKNSTTITIINDYKFEFRRDGGFHTAIIHFYSTNANLLDRWDRISFGGRTWRVSQTPSVKINYKATPDWLYTVTLVESAAILTGIQMPSTTFTQDLEQTKTIEDAINEELKKQEVIAVGDTYRYTLTASPSIDLSAIAPDNKFDKENLYQRLKYWGDLVEAKPILDESTDEIDFEYFNDDNGEVLVPNFVDLEYSKATDGYCTDIIEDIENADLNGVYSYSPGKGIQVWPIPNDITKDTTWDNARFLLPHNVKRITSISAYNASDASTIFITSYELSGNKYIFEKKEWETLDQETAFSWLPSPIWGSLRVNSVYWEYGKNEIFNIPAILTHSSDLTDKITDYAFYIEYEALPNVQVAKTTGLLLDGDIKYTERINQTSNTVSFEAESTRIASELANRQSAYYNGMFYSDTIPDYRSKITVLGNDYLIEKMDVVCIGERYEANVKIPTVYNKRNPLTQVISENRIFEIPSTQTVVRKVTTTLNAKIEMRIQGTNEGGGVWDDYNQNFLFNFSGAVYGGSGNLYATGYVMMLAEFKYRSENTYVAVGMQTVQFQDDSDIVIVSKMMTNTAVDYQRYVDNTIPVVYTATAAIVTDENGENESIKMKYAMIDETTIVDTSSTTFLEIYPFVSSDFFQDGYYGTPATTIYDFDIHPTYQIWKDRREALQFENRIHVEGIGTETTYNTGNTVVHVDSLLSGMRFFNNTGAAPIIALTIDGTEYFATGVQAVFYANKIKINFYLPATGALTLVKVVRNSDILLERTIKSMAGTSGSASYVMISIQEE